ncbi:hypothetical protein ABL78_1559 [Leptomonas seymouri]|uniref:Las1-like protein n=1 Tax=Leptomonas seymouri TaxID=5684 RepID=A0A0N1IAG6_LEPSE|nr:hypothetical protein ABL78_1559 [Leptomonas seymouri]|eukprot:KPI89330.1 hypothetical protein ABL78_1559 [Leptomonas seymouri]
MRRSQVDEARRRQAAAERRFRGHRIRGGLDELGDLDLPRRQRQRKETTATVAAPAPPGKTGAKDAASTGAAPLLSSSTAVSSTVFGPDWSAWIEVKRVLFDMEAAVEAKRTALDKMRVWHLRTRKERALPPYVEATEVLLDAMLQDESDAVADGPQRMCYGAAISRVVHIMTGSFASGHADTYRKRAQEIGFPEEAVEVRQRVAHGVLPLTSELRWVCGLVLQFVFTEYWLEQERQLYLMQQADEASVVMKKQKGGKAQKSVPGAAATGAKPSTPPPSVSMDDIKALLADLEGGGGDRPVAVAVVDKTDTPVEDAGEGEKRRANAAAAAVGGDADNTGIIAGWRLS